MDNYIDPYGFKPLEPALHDVLVAIEFDENSSYCTFDFDNLTAYKELEKRGYLHDVIADMSGNVCCWATTKGRRYPSDFSDFEERRKAWERDNEERREREREQDRKHDWNLNTVNGVYAIVSALLGGVIGYFLGYIT